MKNIRLISLVPSVRCSKINSVGFHVCQSLELNQRTTESEKNLEISSDYRLNFDWSSTYGNQASILPKPIVRSTHTMPHGQHLPEHQLVDLGSQCKYHLIVGKKKQKDDNQRYLMLYHEELMQCMHSQVPTFPSLFIRDRAYASKR